MIKIIFVITYLVSTRIFILLFIKYNKFIKNARGGTQVPGCIQEKKPPQQYQGGKRAQKFIKLKILRQALA
jgi:hypothetical protein